MEYFWMNIRSCHPNICDHCWKSLHSILFLNKRVRRSPTLPEWHRWIFLKKNTQANELQTLVATCVLGSIRRWLSWRCDKVRWWDLATMHILKNRLYHYLFDLSHGFMFQTTFVSSTLTWWNFATCSWSLY